LLPVETQNQGDDVKFLYRLIEEGASQSFGIYVAKLAGLPESLLSRSKNILESLEKNESINLSISEKNIDPDHQLSFFAPIQEVIPPNVPNYLLELECQLKSLCLNSMTPLETMNKLSELQKNILQ